MVDGQTDLDGTSACATHIGTSGGAMIGQALATAVQPVAKRPGRLQCSFLR
jgi:hypothetical protein